MQEERDFRNFKVDISIISILLFFMAGFAGSSESPGMQVIIEYWTARGVSVPVIRMMSTIQSLVSLPLTLTIGTFVGRKVKYRTVAIASVACIVVGSLGPFFYHPVWGVVLAFRALIGIGVGLGACRTSLLLSSVPPERRTQFMGIAQGISISIGLVSGPIVGWLSSISWAHVFLINVYTIVVLCFMFFIKEPPALEGGQGNRLAGKFSPVMLKYALLQPFAGMFSFTIIVGMSTYLAGHQLGNATMTGTVLILYGVGSLLVSMLSKVQKVLGRFTMPVCYGLVAAAYLLLVFFPSLPTAFLAAFITAFGYMGSFSLMQVYAGNAVSREQIPLASSILLTGNAIGMFFSSPMMTWSHAIFHLTTDADSSYAMGSIIYVIFVIIALIPGILVPKEKKEGTA